MVQRDQHELEMTLDLPVVWFLSSDILIIMFERRVPWLLSKKCTRIRVYVDSDKGIATIRVLKKIISFI